MSQLSDKQVAEYQRKLVQKLTQLLEIPSAKGVEAQAQSDEKGVTFAFRIPKGNQELVSATSDLAALIAERHS